MTQETIIYVIGSLDIGGAERHLLQVLPRLDRSRWNPVVYCLTERGALADQMEAGGISILSSPVRALSKSDSRLRRTIRIAQATRHLAATMRSLDAAIAHFFLPSAYILGAPAALLAGVPVRIMSRRSLNEYQKEHRLSAWIERRLHRRMTVILGNSHRVVDQLRQEEHVPADKLGLIYNGIRLGQSEGDDNKRGPVRAALNIPAESLVFAIVANLIPYKGHRDLLDAFGRAAPQLPPDWRLLVAGRDDGIAEDLRRQTDRLGIARNVMFLGLRDDVGDLLRASDVNLLSSHQEGFSNSVLEGLAAGLPSIVTDVGGNAEAVIDGESGFVVPPHDPQRFAAAIERIAADRELRAAMGRNARQRVEQNFCLDACVARYEALYDSLLSGRRPSEIEAIRIR